MAIRDTLKSYFQAGLRPTQSNFEGLIDNTVNLIDDKADATQVIDSTNDTMYVTPKGAKKVVDTYAVTKVNNVSPTNGNITLTSITGNAATATKLATPRNINGVPFDGSADIAIISISGNSGTATKLATSKNINGVAFDGSADIFVQRLFEMTTAPVNSSSTTRTNVAGLSFSAVAGKKYKIELIGDYQTTVLTVGGSLGFIMVGGTATVKGNATMETSITSSNNAGLRMSVTSVTASASNPGSFMTSSGVSVINAPHNLSATLLLSCTVNGVFQVQWGSAGAGSTATLNSGTVLLVTQLN